MLVLGQDEVTSSDNPRRRWLQTGRGGGPGVIVVESPDAFVSWQVERRVSRAFLGEVAGEGPPSAVSHLQAGETSRQGEAEWHHTGPASKAAIEVGEGQEVFVSAYVVATMDDAAIEQAVGSTIPPSTHVRPDGSIAFTWSENVGATAFAAGIAPEPKIRAWWYPNRTRAQVIGQQTFDWLLATDPGTSGKGYAVGSGCTHPRIGINSTDRYPLGFPPGFCRTYVLTSAMENTNAGTPNMQAHLWDTKASFVSTAKDNALGVVHPWAYLTLRKSGSFTEPLTAHVLWTVTMYDTPAS